MFGIDQTAADGKFMQSVNESNNVNRAVINDPQGNPVVARSFGENTTTTRDYYLGEEDVYVNGATNGQTGNEIMTASTCASVNNDFQRVSETIMSFPVSGGATTQSANP